MLQKLKSLLSREKECTYFEGLPQPVGRLRLCGAALPNDRVYFDSARREAQRLVEKCGCNASSRVLDVGCGHGRLAVGLIQVLKSTGYLGLDVSEDVIAWCRRYIGRKYPAFHFQHVDVRNERYHAEGERLTTTFRFPLDSDSFDIIYLFSVFSHMDEQDVRVYLKEFARLLKPSGRLLFTTFVEEGVEPVSINPDGYIFENCRGPLHVVRYEKAHLFELLKESGFEVKEFGHRTEFDSQSVIIAGKPA